MPFPVTCPECDFTQDVPDDVAGKRLRCKGCKAVFRAGNADVDIVDEGPPPAKRGRAEPEDEPRPARRPTRHEDDEDESPRRKARRGDEDAASRRPRAKRGPPPLVLGLVGLIVLLAGGALAAYLIFGRSTPTDVVDPDGVFTAHFPGRPREKIVSEISDRTSGEREYEVKVDGLVYKLVIQSYAARNGPLPPDAVENALVGPRWQLLTEVSGEEIDRNRDRHRGYFAEQTIIRHPGRVRTTILRVVVNSGHRLILSVRGDITTPEEAKNWRTKALEFFDGVVPGPAFGPPPPEGALPDRKKEP